MAHATDLDVLHKRKLDTLRGAESLLKRLMRERKHSKTWDNQMDKALLRLQQQV
jgi:hypothetical protein